MNIATPVAGGMLDREFTQTIDGKAEASQASFDVINPATGEAFARCPDASEAQLDKAIAAAKRAFGPWSRLSFAERADYLGKFAAKVREQAGAFAEMITREQGKPLAHAQREMAGTSAFLEAMGKMDVAVQVLRDDAEARIELRYRPMGVVGAITPWNVPVGLAAHKIAQGLYTGNTMVLKPSPYTPLSTLMLGEIAREVLPPGVLSVLAGGNDLGRWMTEHPDIERISFTGSVATGKKIMASASGTLKRVTLELGGNDPAILLDDVDVEAAAAGVFASAFGNCGQICMAVKRVYVPDHLYEPVCESLAERARAFRVGDGFEPDVEMGPIQNKMQFDKVLDVLEHTKGQPGVRVLAGGHTLNRPGYFMAPTVIADLDEDSRLVTEEQFGPVLPVLRYSDLEDAVRRANDTRFGLCASVWTSDLARGEEVAGRIEAGTVWVNRHGGAAPDVPFGGAKESGMGREHGIIGLQSYMEPQVVTVPKAAR